jgi:hypothetical protein
MAGSILCGSSHPSPLVVGIRDPPRDSRTFDCLNRTLLSGFSKLRTFSGKNLYSKGLNYARKGQLAPVDDLRTTLNSRTNFSKFSVDGRCNQVAQC